MGGRAPLAGIFVGGASRRMGRPKGLLLAPGRGEAREGAAGIPDGETILERLVRVVRAVGCEPALVGDATPYVALVPEVPRIPDDPSGLGPLGGLAALLDTAGPRYALSLGCDMPYIKERALVTLLDARSVGVAVVAPRRGWGAPFEPMLALWHSPSVKPALARALAEGTRSFQRLFAALDVAELPLTPTLERALIDWDTPEDIDLVP